MRSLMEARSHLPRWLRPSTPTPPAHPGAVRLGFLAAAAAFALDAVAKAWAAGALAGRGTVWIRRPWLALRLLHNPGAMLGFASGYPQAITVLTAMACVGLAALLARSPGGRLRTLGLALMLGGAAGNLASRLEAGSVVDFIRVYGWPGIFNPADVFLRIGVLLILASAIAPGGRPAPHR